MCRVRTPPTLVPWSTPRRGSLSCDLWCSVFVCPTEDPSGTALRRVSDRFRPRSRPEIPRWLKSWDPFYYILVEPRTLRDLDSRTP